MKRKMLTQRYRFSVWCLAAAAIVTLYACSDTLSEAQPGIVDEGTPDGMAFATVVQEQADMQINLGGTKAAAAPEESNPVHPLEGGEGLSVHRLSLPFVGIHPGTVPAGSAAEAETKASREDIVGSDYKAFHDTMAVWGYTDKNRVLFNNTLLTKVNGWRSSLRWPYDTKRNEYVTSDDMLNPSTMCFYALSPSLEAMEMALKNSPSNAVKPQFEYTVPDNPAAQRDLLYGESGDISIASIDRDAHLGKDNKTVPLTFRHILTAVRFAQGNMPTDVTVRRITLSGIKNKGTYNPANYNSATNPVTSGWGSLEGSKSYSVYPMHDVTAYGSHVYIDNDSVFFLMPQTLAAGATMTVVLRKDGEAHDRTLTCSINGDVFQEGYTVTYMVTVGELEDDYYLIVDPEIKSHDATGASDQTFTVHSYRRYIDYHESSSGSNVDVATRWKVTGYSLDKSSYSETSPDWLTVSGAGVGDWRTGGSAALKYSLDAQTAVYTLNHASVLASNNIGGASNLDLSCYRPNGNGFDKINPSASDNGSTRQPYQTANCYIVNAPGTYSFPIVYGNAYDGSTTCKTGDALNPGSIFKDHANRTITSGNIIDQVNYEESALDVVEDATSDDKAKESSATKVHIKKREYLYSNSGNDYQAQLVWQDRAGLFSGVTILSEPVKGGTPGYIAFRVGSNPQPGNCVIAFQGKKTIKETRRLYNGDTDLGVEWESITTADVFETLWTWHIWCTDEVLPNNNTFTVSELSGKQVDLIYPRYDKKKGSRIPELENFSGVKTSVMPVNLGWVPQSDEEKIYQERDVWVKIVQETSGKEAVVKIHQDCVPDIVPGTSTIYQWGRPTALPMLRQYDAENTHVLRNVYGATGETPITSEFVNKDFANIGDMALYPKNMGHCSSPKGAWSAVAPNVGFWNATKTLYDPCPAGYQLPEVAVFTGFSITGASSNTRTDLNMWPSDTQRYYAPKMGGYMYAAKHTSAPSDVDRYGTMVFIPTNGVWSGDNTAGTSMSAVFNTNKYMFKDPSMGYCWTYSSSDNQAVILSVQPDYGSGSGKISFETKNYIWDALPIRPMAQ